MPPRYEGQGKQVINDVAKGGFVAGWEPALLGNGLSCLSTLFLLSRRCGVPAVYTYPKAFEGVFVRDNVEIVDAGDRFDPTALQTFLANKDTLFATEPVNAAGRYTGLPLDALSQFNESRTILFSEHRIGLSDWYDDGAEDHLRRFCQSGNGLILTGAYWRQYLDMRPLREEGKLLKEHLGPLRPERSRGRSQRAALEKASAVLRIGIHLRLAEDYGVWMGGIYRFPIGASVTIMDRLSAELGDQPHTFYLFSDQALPSEPFSHLPVHYERGAYFDDFIALASCDYVVGPPSTFASWATFLGEAKRIVLTRERIDDNYLSLLSEAIDLPFPNGHYIPGDATGRTV